VKALVAVEPAGIGDPAQAAALKNIPTLMIFGDYNRAGCALAAKSGRTTTSSPTRSARRRQRRCHQPPRDRHQGQLAHADDGQEQCGDREVIQKWLVAKGLVD